MRGSGQSGQALVEYILVTFLVITMLAISFKWFKRSEYFFKNITKPVVAHIRYNYKYGDPTAQGWDEGEAKKHIEIVHPEGQTFRLFTPEEK